MADPHATGSRAASLRALAVGLERSGSQTAAMELRAIADEMDAEHATPDRAASIQDALELGRTLGRDVERERISLGIEGIDTHQIEGTPLRDVLVFREDVFKVIHGD